MLARGVGEFWKLDAMKGVFMQSDDGCIKRNCSLKTYTLVSVFAACILLSKNIQWVYLSYDMYLQIFESYTHWIFLDKRIQAAKVLTKI